MFPLCLPDLRQPRARIFFWLGLLILPLFWVWCMNKRWFSRTERIIGWTWTGIYTVIALQFHQELAGYFTTYLSVGHPIIAIWITIGLSLWLMVRDHPVFSALTQMLLIFFVFGAHIIDAIDQLLRASLLSGVSFHLWLLPLIPTVLHLCITPDWGGIRKAP